MAIVPSDYEPGRTAGERRHLTVMFCDLVGSSGLANRLDPEDWNEILSGYRKMCGDLVAAADAHVAETPGDGLVVYFGWPVAHEDAARRAVQAGLDIIDAIQ